MFKKKFEQSAMAAGTFLFFMTAAVNVFSSGTADTPAAAERSSDSLLPSHLWAAKKIPELEVETTNLEATAMTVIEDILTQSLVSALFVEEAEENEEETTIEEREEEVEEEMTEVETMTEAEPETEPQTEPQTEAPVLTYRDFDTPENDWFKSYMDYRTITDTSSAQYSLQQRAYTDWNTGIRVVDGRYCIALGSYYTTVIGTYVDVILENGTVIPCILADCKDDAHTDIETHRQNPNGSVVEFVVDADVVIPIITGEYGSSGDVSDAIPGAKSDVSIIRLY